MSPLDRVLLVTGAAGWSITLVWLAVCGIAFLRDWARARWVRQHTRVVPLPSGRTLRVLNTPVGRGHVSFDDARREIRALPEREPRA